MKKIIISIFVIFLTSFSFSQSAFNVDYDYARFNYNNNSGLIEIYYAFYQPQMRIVSNGDQLLVKGSLRVKIQDEKTNNILTNKSYGFSSLANDTANSENGKSLTGNISFLLPFGDYIGTLEGRDANDSTKIDSVSFKFTIGKLPDNRLAVSDIELASSIKESTNQQSIFYKNTYEVVPNPSGLYGSTVPVIYFYSEIYNYDLAAKSDQLKVDYYLINTKKQTVYKRTRIIPGNTKSLVEVGAINASKFTSGAYSLVLAVSDSIANVTIYSTKKVYVYNPSVVDTSISVNNNQQVISSEFIGMSDEELDEVFNESKYVATNREIDQWKTINDIEGKRNFLFNFWKARDTNLDTPQNEYKKEYFERVAEANRKYSNIQKKGWRTDRGRVLILYGEPSEIERHPNQVDTKPYEIWRYEQIEGGVYFVFADLSGFSDYSLLSSTKRGELRDDNWMRKIQTL